MEKFTDRIASTCIGVVQNVAKLKFVVVHKTDGALISSFTFAPLHRFQSRWPVELRYRP